MARTPKDPQSHLFRLPSSMIVRRFAPRFPPGNLWGSLGSALFRPGPPRGLARLRKVSNALPRSRARLCVIFVRIPRVPRLRLIPSSPCVCAQRSFYKSSEVIRRSRARFRGGGIEHHSIHYGTRSDSRGSMEVRSDYAPLGARRQRRPTARWTTPLPHCHPVHRHRARSHRSHRRHSTAATAGPHRRPPRAAPASAPRGGSARVGAASPVRLFAIRRSRCG